MRSPTSPGSDLISGSKLIRTGLKSHRRSTITSQNAFVRCVGVCVLVWPEASALIIHRVYARFIISGVENPQLLFAYIMLSISNKHLGAAARVQA